MTEKADRQITTLLRARVPVIAIESPEETRVLELMKAISANPRFPEPREPTDLVRCVYTWNIALGFQCIAGKDCASAGAILDPIAALEWVLAWDDGTDQAQVAKPAIFVMVDFQPYLQNPRVVRLVREIAFAFRKRRQNLILLAPVLDLPAELRHDVTQLDYPLPDPQEMMHLVEVHMDAAGDAGVTVNLNGDRDDLPRALAGLTRARAQEALKKAIIVNKALNNDAIPVILGEKARIIRESGALEYYHQQAGWSDIGGLDLLKNYAARTIRTFEPEAEAFGVDRRRGILLVGLPGCGKSLTAKAIAGGRIPLVRLDVGALFGGLVGQSESQTRQALKVVEALGRCVLWIDEIEKALASGGEMDGGTSQRVLGTILTWMEESTAPVFIIATANDIARLRPELVRRFDATFFVDLPDTNARQEIAAIHLRKRGRNPEDYDLEALVRATPNFTGAEIEQVIQEAIAAAYVAGAKEIADTDLLREAALIVPLIDTMKEEMTHMRTWATRARAASSAQEAGIGGAGASSLGMVEL